MVWYFVNVTHKLNLVAIFSSFCHFKCHVKKITIFYLIGKEHVRKGNLSPIIGSLRRLFKSQSSC